ncbi:hypothetical protein MPC1_1800002 [Methylocella tundrae]|nr:hypothetical protein MPC1_1800002 [Methylocella tundrae]
MGVKNVTGFEIAITHQIVKMRKFVKPNGLNSPDYLKLRPLRATSPILKT